MDSLNHKRNTIGGNICVRNGNEFDFCWREAIQSLLPVCDEVVVCDGQSTDGTWEDIQEWANIEPKIKTCVYEWKEPSGDPDFWVNWLNYARIHVKSDWHLQLDADEVLHEDSYPAVIEFVRHGDRSAICTRWNFWGDHQHIIPEGECVGKHVKRLAPQRVWMPSDGVHPLAAEICSLETWSSIQIFHYGFIRKRSAFFTKEKLIQKWFFGFHDPRLDVAEQNKGDWSKDASMPDWCRNPVAFTGTHPELMKKWINERL